MDSERRLVPAADGTRIFAERHGRDGLTPLLCLPGLTRNGRDFEPVVEAFAQQRHVITVDFRGRGRSDSAADPLTYRPDVEMGDTLAVLQAFGLSRVAVLGTSRGGLVGLLMATQAADVVAGLCLNDIGPKLEPQGLLRIMSYVGFDLSFADWDSCMRAFGGTSSGFSGVSEAQWLRAVQRCYTLRPDGRVAPFYDLKLATSLPPREDVIAGKIPELWGLLPALQGKPVTCLRGENSDLLSRETLHRLCTELPGAEGVEIANRGHVPFLDEPESVAALTRWLARVDSLRA